MLIKYFFIILLFSSLPCRNVRAQFHEYTFPQLGQLDSIGHSNSIGRHFGSLYFDFLQLVEQELEKSDSTTRRLVRHFEAVFAQFYIDACIAYRDHREILLPAWRTYFKYPNLKPEQYNLLGANAHLNGGLAEAIAGSYTPGEWKLLKSKYVLFNKCLDKTLEWVCSETIELNGRAKILDLISLGFDRTLSRYYLYKWRKRQMRLTEYYFAGSPKYKLLLNKITRKKGNIDQLILAQL